MRRCVAGRRLALLGAGWFAAAAPGQIIYHDIPDRTVDRFTVTLDLDMNGVTDFSFFRAESIATTISASVEGNRVRRPSQSSHFAAYLTDGAVIEPSTSFKEFALLAERLCEAGACAWFGPFPQAAAPGFIGVEFLIDGMTHFGWIRAQVSRTSGIAVIFDYAYQSQPGVPIAAGQVPAPGAGGALAGGLLWLSTRRRRRFTPASDPPSLDARSES